MDDNRIYIVTDLKFFSFLLSVKNLNALMIHIVTIYKAYFKQYVLLL